jgi:hypothetical protein
METTVASPPSWPIRSISTNPGGTSHSAQVFSGTFDLSIDPGPVIEAFDKGLRPDRRPTCGRWWRRHQQTRRRNLGGHSG